jgi:SAM-dependent methyltransferase
MAFLGDIAMKGVLPSLPTLSRKVFERVTRGKWPRHFIDAESQIETTSRLAMARLRSGTEDVDANNLGYVGSQPSVVRAAIRSIPNRAKSAFVDLGCGKGRVLAIATEFEFTDIAGIEIAAPLVKGCATKCSVGRQIASRSQTDCHFSWRRFHAVPRRVEASRSFPLQFLRRAHNRAFASLPNPDSRSNDQKAFCYLYPDQPRSRKSLGEIIRKLSVTESQNSAHLSGT